MSACRCRSRRSPRSRSARFAGFVNGLIITRFGVPPLIATLATLALYRGLAEGISQARSVRGYPDWFYVLGQGEVLGVPTQLWILLAAAIVAAVILGLYALGPHRLRHRRQRDGGALLRAVGRADEAAHLHRLRLSPPPSPAVIFVSRVSTTRSDMGTGIELDAITAVVLGGT